MGNLLRGRRDDRDGAEAGDRGEAVAGGRGRGGGEAAAAAPGHHAPPLQIQTPGSPGSGSTPTLI